MVAWKGLAATGAVLVLTVGAIGALAQPAGQSGIYPYRLPGMLNDRQFEIQAPWGGSTTARRLGVTLKELSPAEARERKLPVHSGLLVETVLPKGAAEKAGLRPGDVIIKVNGEVARSIAQVRRLVNETAVGQNAVVTVFRDGKTLDISVSPEAASPSLDLLPDDFERKLDEFRKQLPRQLDEWRRGQPRWFDGPYYFWFDPPSGQAPRGPLPDQAPRAQPPDLTPGAPSTRPRWPLFRWSPGAERLGIVVQDIGSQLADYFKVKSGVLVASVTPLSPAELAGLRAGDVITAVNGKDVAAATDLLRTLRDMKDGEEVTLKIVRASNPMTIKMKLGAGRQTWHV